MIRNLDLPLDELVEQDQVQRDRAITTSSQLMSDDEHDARMERVVDGLNSTLDELVDRARRTAQPISVSQAAAPRHSPYLTQPSDESTPPFKRSLIKPFPTDVTVEQARDFFQTIAGPVKEVYLGINMAEVVFRDYHGFRAYLRLDGSTWVDNGGKTIRVIPVYGPRSIEQVAQGGAGPQAMVASTLTDTKRRRERRRRTEAARLAAEAAQEAV